VVSSRLISLVWDIAASHHEFVTRHWSIWIATSAVTVVMRPLTFVDVWEALERPVHAFWQGQGIFFFLAHPYQLWGHPAVKVPVPCSRLTRLHRVPILEIACRSCGVTGIRKEAVVTAYSCSQQACTVTNHCVRCANCSLYSVCCWHLWILFLFPLISNHKTPLHRFLGANALSQLAVV